MLSGYSLSLPQWPSLDGARVAIGLSAVGFANATKLLHTSRMTSFGSLLRSHRQRAQLSLPALGQQVSLDFSYLSRLERGQREPPRRAAILDLATALDLKGEETDMLLVAADQLPQALAQLGPLDTTISRVTAILTDPAISTADRQRFRQIVALLAAQWRGR